MFQNRFTIASEGLQNVGLCFYNLLTLWLLTSDRTLFVVLHLFHGASTSEPWFTMRAMTNHAQPDPDIFLCPRVYCFEPVDRSVCKLNDVRSKSCVNCLLNISCIDTSWHTHNPFEFCTRGAFIFLKYFLFPKHPNLCHFETNFSRIGLGRGFQYCCLTMYHFGPQT